MPTISLIAKPGGLDPALAEVVRNACGGGDLVWLAPHEAAEFEVPEAPSNLGDLRAEVDRLGVDMNLVAPERRRAAILLADMDSTMIGQECIDELADMAGVGEAVRAVTARAMNGELEFEEALRERVAQLRGLPERTIEEVLRARIRLAPGGPVLLATMSRAGAWCGLVSGGFTAFSKPVAERLGFDGHRANVLLAEGGVLTGEVAEPILGREAKVETLEAIARELGLGPERALAVGDGANDLGMIGRAGLGVALHAKPSVQEAAPIRINHGDLTALLYLQGFTREDFVVPAGADDPRVLR